MGSIRDPYPGIALLRAAAPVHRIDLGAAPRDAHVPPSLRAARWIYTVVTYDAVEEVLRDAARFSSAFYAESMGAVMGHTILEMDGQEHVRHRALLSRAFTRRAVERWERELVRPTIEAYVGAFAESGQADLVRQLTFPFPVRVIAGMMGLPRETHAEFHRLAVELISVSIDWECGIRASRALRELFAPVVAARRRAPQDDLISVLAHAQIGGTRLRDEEIYAFLCLLAPAGAETTYRSSSNLLYGLLTHPDQLDAVRRDRRLIPQAIEEGLRWECPLLGIMRLATCDAEIGGVPIPKGSVVSLNLGAANRDPARWPDPDRFDVFRAQRPHIAFAIGTHVCLGMHLARMETRVLLETLFDRLPNLHLDPDARDVHVTGLIFRSPQSLPVRFDGVPQA
ncbi:MAG: cytochrome P450 [Proteobacteria bacterium]|nr:MAG: cytochrome P450 [Pseudomonadota bacterium]